MWPNDPRSAFVEYALKMVGTPYIYGGDDFFGIDCSGLAVEALRSLGIIGRDHTAAALQHLMKQRGAILDAQECKPGYLAFYYRDGIVGHVVICINDFQVVEAAGGGRETTTAEKADKAAAFVKIRPFTGLGLHSMADPIRLFERR